MTKIISKAELARWAAVARSTVTRACNGPLKDATTDAGVDAEHFLVREWLSGHGVYKLPVIPPPKAVSAEPDQADSEPPAKPTPPPPIRAEPPTAHDLEHLEDLTIRDVVMRYGSVDGFKRFVDSLKSISEFKYKELRAKQQRGELIERSKVANLVFPMIDVAFSRLVTDVPVSTSKLVVARVQSGGPEMHIDVQKIIQDANSRVLKNVKQSVESAEILNGGDY